jgi:uncharacterized protein
MTTKADIQEFVSQPVLALVGVSHTAGKFSNAAYKELKQKGYTVYAVNPAGGTVEGDPIYPSLSALPGPVGGALVFVKPQNCLAVVRECAERNIQRVWLQQGAQSEEALRFCQENGLRAISGECILMYAGQSKFHGYHRFFREIFGKKLKEA